MLQYYCIKHTVYAVLDFYFFVLGTISPLSVNASVLILLCLWYCDTYKVDEIATHPSPNFNGVKFWMDKQFHPTLNWVCYLSIHVSKRVLGVKLFGSVYAVNDVTCVLHMMLCGVVDTKNYKKRSNWQVTELCSTYEVLESPVNNAFHHHPLSA